MQYTILLKMNENKYIIEIDKNTFGKEGQLISTTKIIY